MYTLMEYRLYREKLYKVILFDAAEIQKFPIYVKSIKATKVKSLNLFFSFFLFFVYLYTYYK